MHTFQSTYRSLDLNFGKKVLQFHNFVLRTSDDGVVEFLRRHAERNPTDIWELEIPTKEEALEAIEPKTGPKRRGRPPKSAKVIRGSRTSEVTE